MNLSDIARLNAHVSDFARARGWTFKALPVVTYEFAAITDFLGAYSDLLAAIRSEPYYVGTPQLPIIRTPTSHTVEIDCYAVTFRLVCHAKIIAHDNLPYGVGDIVRTTPR